MMAFSFDMCKDMMDGTEYLLQTCLHDIPLQTETELVVRHTACYSRRLVGARVEPAFPFSITSSHNGSVNRLYLYKHKMPEPNQPSSVVVKTVVFALSLSFMLDTLHLRSQPVEGN